MLPNYFIQPQHHPQIPFLGIVLLWSAGHSCWLAAFLLSKSYKPSHWKIIRALSLKNIIAQAVIMAKFLWSLLGLQRTLLWENQETLRNRKGDKIHFTDQGTRHVAGRQKMLLGRGILQNLVFHELKGADYPAYPPCISPRGSFTRSLTSAR